MHHHPPQPLARSATLILLLVTLAAMLSGCASVDDTAVRQGYAALSRNDPNQALSLSSAQLRKTPTGPAAAEAYYLRGRALELSPARSPAESATNLAAARAAYTQTLAMNPSRQLKAYTEASLGNVAYFQDDYAAAASGFRAAYDDLDTDDAKAWTLYRTAMSYQRLGQFSAADHYFAETQRLYPNTLQAKRSAENTGARAFYLRLGAYNSHLKAEAGAAGLRKQGFRGISIFQDSRGLYLLRVGPYQTYTAARDAKLTVANRYPDALIMP